MKDQPPDLEVILELLRNRAAAKHIALIVEARIAVGSRGAQVLDIRPDDLLETISY